MYLKVYCIPAISSPVTKYSLSKLITRSTSVTSAPSAVSTCASPGFSVALLTLSSSSLMDGGNHIRRPTRRSGSQGGKVYTLTRWRGNGAARKGAVSASAPLNDPDSRTQTANTPRYSLTVPYSRPRVKVKQCCHTWYRTKLRSHRGMAHLARLLRAEVGRQAAPPTAPPCSCHHAGPARPARRHARRSEPQRWHGRCWAASCAVGLWDAPHGMLLGRWVVL